MEDECGGEPFDGKGSAYTLTQPEDEPQLPIATLWLPNPGTRGGWQMRHVWATEERKPQRRLGF